VARPSIRIRSGASGVLVGLALAVAACGGVSVPSDGEDDGQEDDGQDDGGSEADAGNEPDPDGSSADAAPVADAAPPAKCEDGITQLLANPGFEEAFDPEVGAIGWTEDPVPITYPSGQIPVSPHSPERAAWFGDEMFPEQRLTQAVSVPEATTALRLEVFICFATDEPDDMVYDLMTVSLLDERGDPLETLAEYTNLDATAECSWRREVLDASDTYAGEDIRLELFGMHDGLTLSSFYFDTLRLEAEGPCP
jgi:hypothetical protein